jgi:3-deoxy-manno-octulosonate cytidylyltransferase (CMP-KDO synthetase)
VKILGVIPARLAATRLPRKPLLAIAGAPMIQRVYDGARQSAAWSALLVATDSNEILDYCRSAGIPAERTSPRHASGTDRIREVAARHDADVVANIQGDEPMVTGRHVEALLAPFQNRPETAVATLAVPLEPDQAGDPNVVKVVRRRDGRALYFSRAPIPFDRDGTGVERLKHLGFYAYRRDALERFGTFEVSALERAERLEQLRLLENGIDIDVRLAPSDTWSVDTAEDLARVEEYFRLNVR